MAEAPQKRFLAWRRQHALPPGSPCANCETVLLGSWCHFCGQSAHDFHRHAHHLIAETFESVFHADGRLWVTLRRLVFDPGRLTRDYIDGHRMPQIPPLRLFLVAMFVLFLIGGWSGQVAHTNAQLSALSAQDRADIAAAKADLGLSDVLTPGMAGWLRVRAGQAVDHPDEFLHAMGERSEDFAFLMLPISAFILATLTRGKRSFVLFDHFIFSMHSLSFLGLVISACLASRVVLGEASALLLLVAPSHLYAHLRGTYAFSRWGTVWRMGMLFAASSIGFAFVLAGLVYVGLRALSP